MSEQAGLDWFSEQFTAPCPHGAIKNYCAACLSDEDAAKRLELERKRAEAKAAAHAKRQSGVIEAQAAEIRRLQQLQAETPKQSGRRRWGLGRNG